MHIFKRHTTRYLLSLSGLLLLVLLWQILSTWLAQSMPLANLLAPLPTFDSLWKLLTENHLSNHILASLQRVAIGLIWATIAGIPLGLLVGQSPWFASLSGAAFQFLRMISPLSWMPVVVMLLGIGNPPIYFLLAFAAVWPILLNTAVGVQSISPAWRQLAQSLAATRSETIRKIILPAVLGHILTGLRLAVGVVWIVLVPCEMLGVNEGLGYFILDTRDRLAYSELMAAIIVIGILGWALDTTIRAIQAKWHY